MLLLKRIFHALPNNIKTLIYRIIKSFRNKKNNHKINTITTKCFESHDKNNLFDKIDEVRSFFFDDISILIFNSYCAVVNNNDKLPKIDMIINLLQNKHIDYSSNINILKAVRDITIKVNNGEDATVIFSGDDTATGRYFHLISYFQKYIPWPEEKIKWLLFSNNFNLWETHHKNNYLSTGHIPSIDFHALKSHSKNSNCYIFINEQTQYLTMRKFNFFNYHGFNKNKLVPLLAKMEFSIDNQYFEPDLIPPPTHSEVFIDGGVHDLGSTMDFIRWSKGSYKKILAFEPDPKNYESCGEIINKYNLKNVELINAALYCDNVDLHFNADLGAGSRINDGGTTIVKGIKLDTFLNGEAASFIKLDIEGAELDMLKGAVETIKKYKPKLAISIYHKNWDFIEISLFIKSLHPSYRFYLRHYSTVFADTILYAI